MSDRIDVDPTVVQATAAAMAISPVPHTEVAQALGILQALTNNLGPDVDRWATLDAAQDAGEAARRRLDLLAERAAGLRDRLEAAARRYRAADQRAANRLGAPDGGTQ